MSTTKKTQFNKLTLAATKKKSRAVYDQPEDRKNRSVRDPRAVENSGAFKIKKKPLEICQKGSQEKPKIIECGSVPTGQTGKEEKRSSAMARRGTTDHDFTFEATKPCSSGR